MLPAHFSEPQRRTSGGVAGLRVVVTLAIFVVAFMAFLVAPLITIAVAALGYSALHARGSTPGAEVHDESSGPLVSHEFGTGAR